LIFRARATPGGLEIIASHFSSQPKPKISISRFSKIFGFAILFVVTIIEFASDKKNREIGGGYFGYASNSIRLLATLTYIFLSSFLMNLFFPRERLVFLQIYSQNEEKRNLALRVLAEFSPTYRAVYQKKDGKERQIHVTSCYLSR